MKQFMVSTRIFIIVLVLGLFHFTALVPSELCLAEEGTSLMIIRQIAQNIEAAGVKMNKGNLKLAAETVLEESLRYGVDYRLIMAIMKVESNYRQYVISPDGAMGFMQIHPSLAGGIAKEAGIQYSGLKDLYDPQKNIRLGIYYISKLMDLFKDIPTALFAYNVGHHKAKKLLAADRSPHTPYTKQIIAEYQKNTKNMISL